MEPIIIKERTFRLAVNIIQLHNHLIHTKKEYTISKQILRSGTAIGASVRESRNAESSRDFIHKLSIAQKECDETLYWLELLHETEFITQIQFEPLHSDATQILKMLKSTILTMKRKLSNPPLK